MFDCIIIGAGPGGIVTTKELIENGVTNILCLDQADKLGGVFAASYDNLKLTSSATFSMFSDFFNKSGESNHFWSKDEAVDYWKRYAEKYNVIENIQFNSTVTKVTNDKEGNWKVYLNSQEPLYCKKLVLATGNNCIEKYPEWSKKLTNIEYCHSKNYQNSSPFSGKRVLIVGGGESASDMALEISQVASACWVSLRESTGWVVPRKRGMHATDISTHRGLWGLPRKYGKYLSQHILKLEKRKSDPVTDAVVMLNSLISNPKGIWGTYGTKTIALAEAIAHHNCKVVGEITDVKDGGRHLTTSDGVSLEDIDAVVFSTGYTNRVPFMPEELQTCDPRSLYKHIFHTETQDKLAWVGWARPGFGSQFPIMELQARLFALICAKKHTLPNLKSMNQIIKDDYEANLAQFEGNAERIRSLVDYFRYMDGLAEIIGCKPPLLKYFFRHPLLWLHIVYGPTQSTQYRLTGPGSKVDLTHSILEMLPLSSFNNIVKIGLKVRIIHAINSINIFFRRRSA